MPRKSPLKRPNLVKIADTAATLLKSAKGGWSWQQAVDDQLVGATLTAAEIAELDALLAARGCPRPDPGKDGTPAVRDPGDDVDEGPFYDRDKALDDPGADEDPGEPQARPVRPDDAPDSYVDQEAIEALPDAFLEAHAAAPLERPDDVVGQIVGPDGVQTIDVPRWAADERAESRALDDPGEDEDPVSVEIPVPEGAEDRADRNYPGVKVTIGGDSPQTRELAQQLVDALNDEGHDAELARAKSQRRTARELLAEAEANARRLRVRLWNEQAQERADRGTPIGSEDRRALEALRPLLLVLDSATFDTVAAEIVAAVQRRWGPLDT